MNYLLTSAHKRFCKRRTGAHLLWVCLVLGVCPQVALAAVVGQDTATVTATVENGLAGEALTVVQGPAFTTPANKGVEYHYTEIPGILFWAAVGENWKVYLYFADTADQIRNENGQGGPLEVAFGWELDPASQDFPEPIDDNWYDIDGTYRRIFLESEILSDPDIPPLADGASRVDPNDPTSERKFEDIGSRPFVIAVRMTGSEVLGHYQGTFTFDLTDEL